VFLSDFLLFFSGFSNARAGSTTQRRKTHHAEYVDDDVDVDDGDVDDGDNYDDVAYVYDVV
jgi:hypothetical protein